MKHLALGVLLGGCAFHATTGQDGAGREAPRLPAEAAALPGDDAAFASPVVLEADGPGGVDTYDLVRGALGPDSLEVPDQYANNHPGVPHLREEVDDVVGPHFVFLLHRDRDGDRDIDPATTDRQRNEIKAYAGSAADWKAFADETLRLTWRFRLDPTLPVSKNFTHVFQLKGVGGDEQQPLVTFTGAKKSDGDVFEIRYSPASGAPDQVLAHLPWATVRGQWVAATVQATFAQAGALAIQLVDQGGAVLIDLRQPGIDLWREGSFIRPKWGIYRSLADAANLGAEEAIVRFQRFTCQKRAP
jgi:hypothetical protein